MARKKPLATKAKTDIKKQPAKKVRKLNAATKHSPKTSKPTPVKKRPAKKASVRKNANDAVAEVPLQQKQRSSKKLYTFSLKNNAVSTAQIVGICIAIVAFLGIIGLIIRHSYANRPDHTLAASQASEYEKAQANCGKKPYLVVTQTNDYGEQRNDYYAPGFESYETRIKEPPSSSAETKRFDCELDSVLISYATPHYGAAERGEIAKVYKAYAAAKGMKFLAPSYMPGGYKLHRQTLSSVSYSTAYSAVGNEAIDGYYTTCSLLRDAPDRNSLTTYRNAEHTVAKNGAVTLYGEHSTGVDGADQVVIRYAESKDMWCSITKNGERFISNDEITAIMSSLSEQSEEIVLQANPIASED